MAFKMYGKSPMAKKLVGKQENLPEALKAEIRKAPESPMNKRGCKSAYKMKPCPGCKKMCPGCKERNTNISERPIPRY